MIFVTVGSSDDGFNRLVKMVDELKKEGKIKDEIILQIGNCNYIPKNIEKTFKFASWEKMNELSKKAKCVISAAGAGSILTTLRHGTPYIAVPRLEKLKEHTDDHQLELANTFKNQGKVLVANNKKQLIESIRKVNKGWKPSQMSEDGDLRRFLKNSLEKLEQMMN